MVINVVFGLIAVGSLIQGLRVRHKGVKDTSRFNREGVDWKSGLALMGNVQTAASAVHMYYIVFVVVSVLLVFRNYPI